jgi:hypothetical protein
MSDTQVQEQPVAVERVWKKNIAFLPQTQVVGTNGDNKKTFKVMADGTAYEVQKNGSWKKLTKVQTKK